MIERACNLRENIVDHFFSRKVQYQLVSAAHGFTAGNPQRVIRVRPVKIAVLRYHFRLDPDAERKSHCMHFFGKLRKRHAELLLVDVPVAETTVIIVPFSEPAVVDDQKIDAQIFCLFREIQYLLPVKIEIAGFPAVKKNRCHLVFVRSPDHMPADTVGELD